MRTEVIGAEHARWTEVVATLPHDFYQLATYARIEADRLKATAEAVLLQDGDRTLFVPFLTRRCSDIGFADTDLRDATSAYGYPGMLLSPSAHDRNFMAEALEAIRSTLREHRICSLFVRMHPILNADVATIAPPGVMFEEGETVAFDLSLPEERMWREIREGHRVTIRRCREAGFVTRVLPLGEGIDEFMETYRQTMDRVKAKDTYYFEKSYYQALEAMRGVVALHVAEKNGAAAACLVSECQGVMQAHLGGTRDEFLPVSPFHMVLFETAVWGKARGNRFFHLGGGVGGKSDRLLNFKAGFSSTRFRFQTVRMIADENAYRTLISLRASKEKVSEATIRDSGFFPAYRSGL